MATLAPDDGLSKKELQPEKAAVPDPVLGIVEQFVTTYYQTFDTNRAGLAALYHVSMALMWDGMLYRHTHSCVLEVS